jgi:hypothetical protein
MRNLCNHSTDPTNPTSQINLPAFIPHPIPNCYSLSLNTFSLSLGYSPHRLPTPTLSISLLALTENPDPLMTLSLYLAQIPFLSLRASPTIGNFVASHASLPLTAHIALSSGTHLSLSLVPVRF